MTTRGILIFFGVVFWLGAAACWIRARGTWRLSREGSLFFVLGVPFLVAGVFFTKSSYPPERPELTPPPIAAGVPATPPPAAAPPIPTPAPQTYADAVNTAQHVAVARYPDLGRAGTLFNTRFVTAYRQLRASEPNYFTDPGWPLHLADEIARDLKEE